LSVPARGSPSLRELQLVVWRLLAAPEGPGKGLSELEREGVLTLERLEAWIASDERLSALGRVDIYANMYFYRLRDALKEDFPKTLGIIGEDRFHNLVTDYLLVHPSSHWSMRYAGLHLPGFLKGHPLLETYPFLADLAAVEWAHADLFQMEDTRALSREELATVPPERWGDLRFRVSPAWALLDAAWDVAGMWEALERGEGTDGARRGKQHLLVWREGFDVEHAPVADDEAEALSALGAGRTFGEICEGLAGDGGDLEAAAVRASSLLTGWLDRVLLSGCELDASRPV
jgi:hypothetical protein